MTWSQNALIKKIQNSYQNVIWKRKLDQENQHLLQLFISRVGHSLSVRCWLPAVFCLFGNFQWKQRLFYKEWDKREIQSSTPGKWHWQPFFLCLKKFSHLWGRSSELLGRDIRKEHLALLSGLQLLRKIVRKQEHSDHLKNTYLKGSLASHRSSAEKKQEEKTIEGRLEAKRENKRSAFLFQCLPHSSEPLIPQEMRLLQADLVPSTAWKELRVVCNQTLCWHEMELNPPYPPDMEVDISLC